MITGIEPQVAPNGLYAVGATALLLNIHRNSLRNYTNKNLIKCEISKLNGRKLYRGKEIKRFWAWCQTTAKIN